MEEQLFRPLQLASGRAKRTAAGFADRSGLTAPAPRGRPAGASVGRAPGRSSAPRSRRPGRPTARWWSCRTRPGWSRSGTPSCGQASRTCGCRSAASPARRASWRGCSAADLGCGRMPHGHPSSWLMAVAALSRLPSSAAARGRARAAPPCRDGNARFQVLTPTLIRLEYAADGRFEDRPTMTAINRRFRVPRFTTRVEGDTRIIRTSRLTLRYRRGRGPFGAENLVVLLRAGGRRVNARPAGRARRARRRHRRWLPRARRPRRTPTPTRARRRAETSVAGSAAWTIRTARSPCTRAFCRATAGTCSTTPARSCSPAPLPGSRPARRGRGAYQDGYFFGYGHDYARGLRDLRALSGAAPLLPRKTFGNWFSRYWPYGDRTGDRSSGASGPSGCRST